MSGKIIGVEMLHDVTFIVWFHYITTCKFTSWYLIKLLEASLNIVTKSSSIISNMEENFLLRWNDFDSRVSSSLNLLRKDKDFLDLTLVSEDEVKFEAHKVVLSASSPFFKRILKNNPHSHPLLYLNGIDSFYLSLVLDYIYNGEVEVNR